MHPIVGHGSVRAVLRRVQANPAPAYGFFGPEHVGKRGVAQEFASLLVAPAPGLEASAHPDVLVFDARTQGSIEEVKTFLSQVHQTSAYGGRRVFVIDHADELGTAGTNALLKDIEEPRSGTVFLLIASRPDAVPATVRSRLVPLRFERLSDDELQEASKIWQLPTAWAREALGRPGLLWRRNEDPGWWEQTQAFAQRLSDALQQDQPGALIAMLDDWHKSIDKHPEADVRWRVLLLLTMSRWTQSPVPATAMAFVDAWRLLETAIPARVGVEMAWLREHLPNGHAILPRV